MTTQKNWEQVPVDLLEEDWVPIGPGVECFRLPGNEPVRRIITGRRNRRVGAFWSWKNKRHVAHESDGEEICARVLEVHPSVTAYFGQPEQIRFPVPGRTNPVRYTPDFLAILGDREVRIEYKWHNEIAARKPDDEADEQAMHRWRRALRMRIRLRLVRDAYQRCNLTWKLITDRDLARIASGSTVDEIVANSGRPLLDDDEQHLFGFLSAKVGRTATLAECCAQLRSSEFPRGDILSLIPARRIAIDLMDPIHDQTLVRMLDAAA